MNIEKELGQIFDKSFDHYTVTTEEEDVMVMSRERFIQVVTHLLEECREASVKSLFGLNRSVIDEVRSTKEELT